MLCSLPYQLPIMDHTLYSVPKNYDQSLSYVSYLQGLMITSYFL